LGVISRAIFKGIGSLQCGDFGVDVDRLRPEKATAGASVRCISAEFEGIPKALGEPERKLWAA
jgi:hypothetical protein